MQVRTAQYGTGSMLLKQGEETARRKAVVNSCSTKV